MPLTDIKVRNTKPGAKPVKLSDGGGLHLLIQPTGGKLWRMAYRFDGKQKTLALGTYPGATLAQARAGRDAAKKLLAEGMDPMVVRKAEKLRAATQAANTFGAIAEELADKMRREGKAADTITRNDGLLRHASALWARPIVQITAADILAVLRPVEAAGMNSSAHRVRGLIGQVFRYAIATARAENDPTPALRGALTSLKSKHRAAITDADAFGGLLRAIDGFTGQPVTKAALQLLALLFPRPGELREARWAEIDLDKAEWSIPAERMKMRRPHRMPLPVQAVAILRALYPLTAHYPAGLVFPGIRTPLRPISDNTMNGALRRLGYGKEEVTPHGFRATASTLLNESGKWSADAIERALAHLEKNAVRRAYARGEHWDERVRMMQWWADYLDTLRGKNVVPLRPVAA